MQVKPSQGRTAIVAGSICFLRITNTGSSRMQNSRPASHDRDMHMIQITLTLFDTVMPVHCHHYQRLISLRSSNTRLHSKHAVLLADMYATAHIKLLIPRLSRTQAVVQQVYRSRRFRRDLRRLTTLQVTQPLQPSQRLGDVQQVLLYMNQLFPSGFAVPGNYVEASVRRTGMPDQLC